MHGIQTPWRRARTAALASLVGACGGADPVADAGADAPPTHAVPTCPGLDEAPLRRPDGSHRCTPVGASTAPATDEWPDLAGAPAPVVYVRPGGTGDAVFMMEVKSDGSGSYILGVSGCTDELGAGGCEFDTNGNETTCGACAVSGQDIACVAAGT